MSKLKDGQAIPREVAEVYANARGRTGALLPEIPANLILPATPFIVQDPIQAKKDDWKKRLGEPVEIPYEGGISAKIRALEVTNIASRFLLELGDCIGAFNKDIQDRGVPQVDCPKLVLEDYSTSKMHGNVTIARDSTSTFSKGNTCLFRARLTGAYVIVV
jgi:hypothetical protein